MCKITIYITSGEMMFTIYEKSHGYKRVLVVPWHDRKRPTEIIHFGEDRIKYFDYISNLNLVMMYLFYLCEFVGYSTILKR